MSKKNEVQQELMQFWKENQGNRLSSHLFESLVSRLNNVFDNNKEEENNATDTTS